MSIAEDSELYLSSRRPLPEGSKAETAFRRPTPVPQ